MPNLNYIVQVAGFTGKATGYSDAVRAACQKAGEEFLWVETYKLQPFALVDAAPEEHKALPVTILKCPDDHWESAAEKEGLTRQEYIDKYFHKKEGEDA